MTIKLDENLGSHGAEILRAAGHQVTTVVEEGLASATEHELANVCRSDRKCLVTLDLDFSNPLRFAPSRHSGIAVLRLPHRSTADDLFHAVRTLASGLAASTIDGKLWIVQRGHIREYEEDAESGSK